MGIYIMVEADLEKYAAELVGGKRKRTRIKKQKTRKNIRKSRRVKKQKTRKNIRKNIRKSRRIKKQKTRKSRRVKKQKTRKKNYKQRGGNMSFADYLATKGFDKLTTRVNTEADFAR